MPNAHKFLAVLSRVQLLISGVDWLPVCSRKHCTCRLSWNCTLWISFVDTYIFSRNYSLWWYSKMTYWIRSRPLISDNEPTFCMTSNKPVIISTGYRHLVLWKKERKRLSLWWWVVFDVDCSHLYCSLKNILRRGFRTILNKNFHFKFKCGTLSSM